MRFRCFENQSFDHGKQHPGSVYWTGLPGTDDHSLSLDPRRFCQPGVIRSHLFLAISRKLPGEKNSARKSKKIIVHSGGAPMAPIVFAGSGNCSLVKIESDYEPSHPGGAAVTGHKPLRSPGKESLFSVGQKGANEEPFLPGPKGTKAAGSFSRLRRR